MNVNCTLLGLAVLFVLSHHVVKGFSIGTSTHTLYRDSNTKLFMNEKPHVPNVIMVECGFGNDSHGQNATKAAKRACRNAIEFNSISIKKIVPGGYEAMKLNVILAVPKKYQDTLDLDEVAKTFPYGDVKFVVQDGGMIAPSGRIIESLGDKNDDMLIVCAAVQVGY